MSHVLIGQPTSVLTRPSVFRESSEYLISKLFVYKLMLAELPY